jgi:hypothetical protein
MQAGKLSDASASQRGNPLGAPDVRASSPRDERACRGRRAVRVVAAAGGRADPGVKGAAARYTCRLGQLKQWSRDGSGESQGGVPARPFMRAPLRPVRFVKRHGRGIGGELIDWVKGTGAGAAGAGAPASSCARPRGPRAPFRPPLPASARTQPSPPRRPLRTTSLPYQDTVLRTETTSSGASSSRLLERGGNSQGWV